MTLKNIIRLAFFLSLLFLLSSCSTYTSQTIPIKNGQIEYYRMGKGSPIVLIPGYATDVSSWDRRFLATLATHHQLIILNNRNVGRSFVNSKKYNSKNLANDDLQLIQNLHLKKPSILGISMGGMIALKFAALYPNQISHLILINTAISGNQSVHPTPQVQQAILDMPKNKLKRFPLALNLFFPPTWKTKMGFALVFERFVPKDLQEINPDIFDTQKQLILNWANDNKTAHQLKNVMVPTLILNGESDIVIPPINSVILAKTFRHSQLLRWREGGHAMVFQFPESLARSINLFIKNT